MLESKYLTEFGENKEIQRILSKYYTPGLQRVFEAENKKHFSDTGIGEILEITNEIYKILKTILENGKPQEISKLSLIEAQLEKGYMNIFKAIKKISYSQNQ